MKEDNQDPRGWKRYFKSVRLFFDTALMGAKMGHIFTGRVIYLTCSGIKKGIFILKTTTKTQGIFLWMNCLEDILQL